MKKIFSNRFLLFLRYITVCVISILFNKNGYLLKRKLIIGAAILSIISVSCASRRKQPLCYALSDSTYSQNITIDQITEDII
ncbi:MAG: hypothetical protein ABIJ97_15090 [Bacteroidota bacterium]